MTYTEEYYKTQNYSNYFERQERYLKTAEELDILFRKLSLLDKNDVVLDYGCAVGFLMCGFRGLGYSNVFGYDISEWASRISRENGNTMLESINDVNPKLLLALDVFEHMTDQQVDDVLKTCRSEVLVARIPCSTDGGKTFHLEVSRVDPTHVNCKPKGDWMAMLKKHYSTVLRINLNTIYDSTGVACLLAIA